MHNIPTSFALRVLTSGILLMLFGILVAQFLPQIVWNADPAADFTLVNRLTEFAFSVAIPLRTVQEHPFDVEDEDEG